MSRFSFVRLLVCFFIPLIRWLTGNNEDVKKKKQKRREESKFGCRNSRLVSFKSHQSVSAVVFIKKLNKLRIQSKHTQAGRKKKTHKKNNMDFQPPPPPNDGNNGDDDGRHPPRKLAPPSPNDDEDDENENDSRLRRRGNAGTVDMFGDSSELPVWLFLFLAAVLAEHFRNYYGCTC